MHRLLGSLPSFLCLFSPKSFIPNLFLHQILQVSSISDQSESDENESQVTEGNINFINFDFIAVEMNLFLDFKHIGDYCKNAYTKLDLWEGS